MTDLEYRRALLLARIEAHRTLFELEVRYARATVHPLRSMLSMVGLDGALAGAVGAAIGALGGGRHDGGLPVRALVPMAVAALLPLVASLRRDGKPAETEDSEHETD